MNKKELAEEIAGRMSVPVTTVLHFMDTMIEVVGDTVSRKESVLLQNFGHFSPWEQSEREGRNPRTGLSCTIPKRVSVKFKPGKGLLKKINKRICTEK
ncbi:MULTISPECIES: HU family DNA-binding protein [Parabacteroides]|uniref:HU family DNA-binding protein n=1 Tax=Parabacteroides leei TaxID=2939491 RepID=UPI00189B91E9|nr:MULTISPECIES: HU family DNA-binding protein [Parabacteroides]MCL3852064.1 HU family DNA-binding protein [Parabacteroides leei]